MVPDTNRGRAVADPQALAFLTGYLIEKSLAVDNVFVWLMLFSYFSVRLRCSAGCWFTACWGDRAAYGDDLYRKLADLPVQWLLYLFGAFLLFTGVKMALAKEDASGIGDKPLVR